MAITQAQQSEKAYKKSGLNVAMTGRGGAAFFTEPASPNIVYSDKIIGRPDLIPVTAPTTNLVNGTRFNSSGNVTIGTDAIIQYNESTMTAYAGSLNDSYRISSIQGLIIPFNYGNGSYSPKIHANNIAGVNLPFGLNSWELDTAAGVVTFFDGKPASVTANTLGIKYWTYVGPAGGASQSSMFDSVMTFNLDPDLSEQNVSYDDQTGEWLIEHNIGSEQYIAILLINGLNCSSQITYIDNVSLSLIVQGRLDKSTDVQVYPNIVQLTIYY